MKNMLSSAGALLALALGIYAPLASGQSMEVAAGTGRFVEIPGTTVGVRPNLLTASPDGFVYLADYAGRLIRLNSSAGTVTAMPAISGGLNYSIGQAGGMATDSTGTLHVQTGGSLFRMNLAEGTASNLGSMPATGPMVFAPSGVLYFVNTGEHRVYVRSPSGVVTTIAGQSTSGFLGDGGPALNAYLSSPSNLLLLPNGDLLVADRGNSRIRKIAASTGIITTVAGGGANVVDGVAATQSRIESPSAIARDAAGNLYISGETGYRIRRIDAVTNLISTILGDGAAVVGWGDGGPAAAARVGAVRTMAIDSAGNLLFSDALGTGQYIRKINFATGIVSRVIGHENVAFCGEGVPGPSACLGEASGLDADAVGNLLIADGLTSRLRKLAGDSGLITTLLPLFTQPFQFVPSAVEHDTAGNLYMTGIGNQVVWRFSPGGTGVRIAGTGTGASGSTGDGGPATAAKLNNPVDTAIDASGNVFIADSSNNRIRRIDAATGIISTYAGGQFAGYGGENVPALGSLLNRPQSIEFDPQGNLVIHDSFNCRLRRVDRTTGIITSIAGTGICTQAWQPPVPGGLATATQIANGIAFAFDPSGNIYLGWTGDIARIDAITGVVSLVSAPAGGLVTPEGLRIQQPRTMEFDTAGNLYVADRNQPYVFKITLVNDTTPPVVEPNIVGTAGNGDWYRSNVQLTWAVSDPDSSISFSNGCSASSVTTDTSGVTFTCSATSGGGTTTRSVTIKRDVTPPTLTFGDLSPAPDANGWNSGDVTIPFTTNDTHSGVFSTSSGSPITITGEGPNLVEQVVVTDAAGNSATFTSPAVKIDRSAPVVDSTVTGTVGNDGWYRSDVQVAWTVTGNGSTPTTNGCSASSVLTDTAEVTFTCTATSAGGTTSKSVTIKRDATPPTLAFDAASPAADEHGWRAPPLSVPFNASDATSGVATTSGASPLAITQTGAGVTGQVIVTDVAGNSATFTTPAFNADGTAPFISLHVIGTVGANTDWYRTDVQIVWGVHDSESQVLTRDCDNVTLTTDTAGTTYTCSGTSTGGSVTQSVTIKRDATPPTLTWSAPSPAPNANGWFTSNVEFTYTTSDATSGVGGTSQVTPGPVIVTEDGPGQTNQIYVWDNAGNQAVFVTPPVNIDHLPAVVQPFVNGVSGGPSLWHKDDVQLHWNVSKNNIISTNGCEDRLINTDTPGTTFTCSVTSGAWTTTESVTIKRDATPPVLTFGTPSPAPNVNGWNKTNVSIPFTRSDATSGLASTSATSPIVISTEGADLTRQVVVTDLAGNSATYTTVPRNIDKAAPYAEIQVPEDAQTYGFYADVVAQYECVDLSLVSCTGPNAIGELVNTKTAGSRTFKITAKDQSLFTTTHTHTFNVASSFNFDGFLGAANDPPTLNLVARGSLVPIRFRLPDGRGGYVSNTAAFSSATVTTLSCGSAPVAPLNDSASGPAGISYDAGTNMFTYNWQTTASWTGCRKLAIKLKDNSTHELRFKFQ